MLSWRDRGEEGVNFKEKLAEIDKESWPTPVKNRAKELLKASFEYKVVKARMKPLNLYSKEMPALLLDAGRKLQRLGECHKALAAEVAYYITMSNSNVELGGGKKSG